VEIIPCRLAALVYEYVSLLTQLGETVFTALTTVVSSRLAIYYGLESNMLNWASGVRFEALRLRVTHSYARLIALLLYTTLSGDIDTWVLITRLGDEEFYLIAAVATYYLIGAVSVNRVG